jgi:hypothetical protein
MKSDNGRLASILVGSRANRKEPNHFLFADHRLAISSGSDAPVLACEVIN